jgi:hypothetical protein
MAVCIEQVWDEELIYSVLRDERIWPTISNDGDTPEKFTVDVDADDFFFLAVAKENVCIGIYILHPFNNCTMEIHANILPEFREANANESAQKILEWFDKHMDEKWQKIMCRIPSLYPQVYHFTLNRGFTDEGRLVNAFRKNDELHDVHILGLERKTLKGGN